MSPIPGPPSPPRLSRDLRARARPPPIDITDLNLDIPAALNRASFTIWEDADPQNTIALTNQPNVLDAANLQLMRPFSRLPARRHIEGIGAQSVFGNSSRWYCFLGEILAVGTNESNRHEVTVLDNDNEMVVVEFVDTHDNKALFNAFRRVIQPGNVILVLNAKRQEPVEDDDAGLHRVLVYRPDEVKFLKEDFFALQRLAKFIREYSELTDNKGRCYGCDQWREDVFRCPGCGFFWFCNTVLLPLFSSGYPSDPPTYWSREITLIGVLRLTHVLQPASDPNNCYLHALFYHDHLSVCSFLSDEDMARIFTGHYLAIERFSAPVVRHNLPVG
ncbi:hypothetical protein BJY01DRAFT_250545 [Aspergillus pseudoustus]|uniref:Protection of telomeres protein 1 ssDNA-binding domain-containing protein n=1 Tax=Aspergillus pseudoustus TaxID=1810923 RepID=A0ABR4JH48_9EURO